MGDLKIVSFIVFLFIVFGAFVAIYSSSQPEYAKHDFAINESDTTDTTGFGQIDDMTKLETYSTYGASFMAGLGTLLIIVIIRFVRGQ